MTDLEARILVCNLPTESFHELVTEVNLRFYSGPPPFFRNLANMASLGAFEFGPVEYTAVPDIPSAVKAVKTNSNPQDPSHYSLVVYHVNELAKPQNMGAMISDVRKCDAILPQMIMGNRMRVKLDQMAYNAGAKLRSETPEETKSNIHNIFYEGEAVPGAVVVKAGGSSLDWNRYVWQKHNLMVLCHELSRIHRSGEMFPLVTAGAGQHGDVAKDTLAKAEEGLRQGTVPLYVVEKLRDNFPMEMVDSLGLNLKQLDAYFDRSNPDDKKGRPKILNPDVFYFINRYGLKRNILLASTAPHYAMVRDQIPLQDSDTHTLALAEQCGAEKVVIVKRTDGVYKYDPLRGFVIDPTTQKCADYNSWINAQANNQRYAIVTVDQLLNEDFSREGTGLNGIADGTSGHLMEDSALRYFRDNCKHVKEIVIVHIDPSELYYTTDNAIYRHIVDRDDVLVKPDWDNILRVHFQNALRGDGNSKIIRDTA